MTISAEEISKSVAEVCKKFDSVLAVIVNGSCARGEETYFINSDGQKEMISDFEMLIIIKPSADTRPISESLEVLREQLISIRHSENFDLEWSFKTEEDLRRLDKRFFFFETKESSRVIYGDNRVLGLFPEINIHNLNYSELNTVIIHRLYHVLRDIHSEDEKYKKYLIARNSLDFSTAFLPLAGVLVATYAGRMDALQKVANKYQISDDLIRRHKDYLNMKKDYSSRLYDVYKYDDMLHDFYDDFQLLKELQKRLQNGVLFKPNKRRMISAIYRLSFSNMVVCLQWKNKLSALCEDMFSAIKSEGISDKDLDSVKAQMKELFGYC